MRNWIFWIWIFGFGVAAFILLLLPSQLLALLEAVPAFAEHQQPIFTG